jgi:hypothetical protein
MYEKKGLLKDNEQVIRFGIAAWGLNRQHGASPLPMLEWVSRVGCSNDVRKDIIYLPKNHFPYFNQATKKKNKKE